VQCSRSFGALIRAQRSSIWCHLKTDAKIDGRKIISIMFDVRRVWIRLTNHQRTVCTPAISPHVSMANQQRIRGTTMTPNHTNTDFPTRTIVIWSIIGGVAVFGIRTLVVSLWPPQAALPAAVLYIPLTGALGVLIVGIGALRARKMRQTPVAWFLLFLALMVVGCTVFALYASLVR
jgi:hypothetical protein